MKKIIVVECTKESEVIAVIDFLCDLETPVYYFPKICPSCGQIMHIGSEDRWVCLRCQDEISLHEYQPVTSLGG